MKNNTLMVLTCPSDWDGQQLSEGGFIGLRRIAFNCTYWEAPTQLSSFVIPDGGQLVIRREGRFIYIERPPTRKRK